MKYALALCVLFSAVAGQGTLIEPPHGEPAHVEPAHIKVATGSRVGSLTIHSADDQGGSDFRFTIQNSSGSGVTAIYLMLVPKGVPKKDGHYVCNGRCSGKAKLGDIDSPVIPAADTITVSYPADSVEGGAVIIEAAVFADGTYDGREQISTALVAAQLGYQTEFDRVVSAVSNILNGNGLQENKAPEIDSAIAGLAVDTDPDEVAAFERWFPNVQDCSHRSQFIMQGASSSLKTNLQLRVQRLEKDGAPSESTLNTWWKTTEDWLGKFGCAGCTAKLDAPSRNGRTKPISIGCSAPPGGGSRGGSTTTSAASSNSDPGAQPTPDSSSDDGSGDSQDQTAQNDPDLDDSADADSGGDQLAMAEEPAPSGSSDSSSSSAIPSSATPASAAIPPPANSPAVVPVAARCKPMAPRPFGMIGIAPNHENEGAERTILATDDQLYRRYFGYVREWERCFADGQWPESVVQDYPGPYPSGFNGDQREVVRTVADDWQKAEREAMKDRQAAIQSGTSTATQAMRLGPITSWAEAQEREQQRRERQQVRPDNEERTKLMGARLQSLSLALGKAAFTALNTYAYDLYQATPGHLVHVQLPEQIMITRYLSYVGLMDKFAANNNDDGRAAAKARANEQKALGLSNEDQVKLEETVKTLHEMNGRLQPEAGDASPGLVTSTATGTIPDARTPRAMSALPVGSNEMMRLSEKRQLLMQQNLSEAGFEKVKKRAHELYDSEWTQRLMPIGSEPEANQKPPKIATVTPTKH